MFSMSGIVSRTFQYYYISVHTPETYARKIKLNDAVNDVPDLNISRMITIQV